MQILSNKIQCIDCMNIIESYHRHDFKYCKCGGCAVDGGHDYLKRTGSNYEELSINDNEDHNTRRSNLRWGKNTNAQGELLNQTEWIKIKDLSTPHIINILKNVNNISTFYKLVFENELKFRENESKDI